MLNEKFDFAPSIIDVVDALIIVMDAEGRIIFFNKTCERITGYSFNEIKNKHVWDIFLIPEEVESVKAVFNQLRNGIFPNKHVNFWVSKDGNRRIIEWSNTAILDNKQAVKYVVSAGIDVTEQVQAIEALKESEQRYRTLFDNSLDGIYISTPEGKFIYANPALVKMLGYKSQEELLSINITKDLYFTESERPLPEERVKPVITRLKRKDNAEIWVEIHSRVIFGDRGNAAYYQGITRDFTERRQAERAIKESEVRYRTLFENSPISLWEEDFSEVKRYLDDLKKSGIKDFKKYFDDNPSEVRKVIGKVKMLDVNKATMALYGAKNKEEMINRKNDIFPDESLDKIKDGIIAITKGKKRIDLELVNHTLDGRVLQVSISHLVVPGYYESDFSRVLSSRVDITEQKKLEEKLRYMATHDPLTGLYSRTFFEEELSRHSNKRFLPLGVIMFDVDGLKYVNDTFGHVKGDRLLKTTAKILSKVFRSSEILARIGGDEFAVILPNVNDEILKSVIERLELQLSRVNKPRDDTGKINISYGYSIRQNEIVDMAGVLRDADENLYSNKMARR